MTIMKKLFFIGIVSVLIPACASVQQKPKKIDERIIFFGDSITEEGVNPFGFITLTAKSIKKSCPNLEIEIIGSGIAGDRVTDCQKRLDSDVLEKNPTIVVIVIGINDILHLPRSRGTSPKKFEAGLKDLIARISSAGAKVILSTPTVIGERWDGKNKFDPNLDQYSEIGRRVAKETDTQLIDLRKSFLSYLKKHNDINRPKGILTRDMAHLTKKGNNLLAELMVEALSFLCDDSKNDYRYPQLN